MPDLKNYDFMSPGIAEHSRLDGRLRALAPEEDYGFWACHRQRAHVQRLVVDPNGFPEGVSSKLQRYKVAGIQDVKTIQPERFRQPFYDGMSMVPRTLQVKSTFQILLLCRGHILS